MSAPRAIRLAPPAPKEDFPSGPRDLSQRQRQVLALLRAGKVNKEIAQELGIGLGTVKQHVVALFKKLDVRNRAMAVSRGFQMEPEAASPTGMQPADGVLEYRPCLALSLALPEAAPAEAGRRMQQVLATFAFDHDAVFLARKGHEGDLILGIQRATDQDFYFALRAARTVVRELSLFPGIAELRGGLTAGLAAASMQRRGGWSGEAIASIAIAQARELAASALPGNLVLGAAARDLLRVLSPNAPEYPPAAIPFTWIEALPWSDGGSEPALVGRSTELRQIEGWIEATAAGDGRFFQISGETGMGKSRLCRHVAGLVGRRGGEVHRFACRPDGEAALPFASPKGLTVAPARVYEAFGAEAGGKIRTVIVDDCHYLQAPEFERLAAAAARARGTTMALLTARRFPHSEARPQDFLRLGRMAAPELEQLARLALGRAATTARVDWITQRALGVPLFALELARMRRGEALPLSLRMLISARMDGLGLDRVLLRTLTRSRSGWDTRRLARELEEPEAALAASADRAVAAGVLSRCAAGRLRFAHPLLRTAVELAAVRGAT